MHEEESLYLTISPRDERRLLREKSAKRTLGRAIGGLSSGAKKLKDVPFDPTAEDGDGDGKVQDNTRWARPATPGVPDVLDGDYRGQHSAPGREDGAPLHDLTKVYPEDIYSATGRRIYATGEDRIDSQAFELISELRGKPNALVTVYRAVPISSLKRIDELEKQKRYILKNGAIPPGVRTPIDDSSEYYDMISEELEQLKGKTEGNRFSINRGDWVTPFRSYAVEHGQSNLGGAGKYEIVKRKVRARDIYTAGDSWAEWGYDPADEEVQRGLASGGKRNKKKPSAESPKIYTLFEYMNERRNNGEELVEEEQIAADAIDMLAETVISRFAADKIIPISEPVEIFETLGIALELDIDPEKITPEIALGKAIKAFNEKFGGNHKKTSLLLGVLRENLPQLEKDEVKNIINSLDAKELKKLHESTEYKYGDLNLLTGEPIRAFSVSWVRGLTPKQIATLVCPETDVEVVDMCLDMMWGADGEFIRQNMEFLQANNGANFGNRLSTSEFLTAEEFEKTLNQIAFAISQDDFDASKVKQLREDIEIALTESPTFYRATQIFGIPPIGPYKIPSYVAGGNPAVLQQTVLGAFTPVFKHMEINSLLPGSSRKRPLSQDIGPEQYIIGGIGKSIAANFSADELQDTIVHEYGHYVWEILAEAFGASSRFSPKYSNPLGKNLSQQIGSLPKADRDKLFEFIKLFDSKDMTSIGGTDTTSGYFGSNYGTSQKTAIDATKTTVMMQLGDRYSKLLMSAAQNYKYASSGGTRSSPSIAKVELEKIIQLLNQIGSDDRIYPTSKYGSSQPAEAFAEMFKDYASAASPVSRRDFLTRGAIEMFDFIFGIIKS